MSSRLKRTRREFFETATGKTQKGEYHKIGHGAKILEVIEPRKVRAAAPQCERLLRNKETYFQIKKANVKFLCLFYWFVYRRNQFSLLVPAIYFQPMIFR
jgi:hypothetical protein